MTARHLLTCHEVTSHGRGPTNDLFHQMLAIGHTIRHFVVTAVKCRRIIDWSLSSLIDGGAMLYVLNMKYNKVDKGAKKHFGEFFSD